MPIPVVSGGPFKLVTPVKTGQQVGVMQGANHPTGWTCWTIAHGVSQYYSIDRIGRLLLTASGANYYNSIRTKTTIPVAADVLVVEASNQSGIGWATVMVVIYTVGPGTFPSISPQTFNPLVLTQQPNGFGIDQLVTTVDGTNGIVATNMTSAGTWQITSGDPSGFYNNATLSNYLLFMQPDGSAHLRTGAVAPPVGTATMNIRATNAIGPGYSGTSTISVTVPQSAPVVSNQSYLLPQTVVAGPLVPNMTATNTPTAWTITGGDPSGTQNTAGTSYFLINNSGQLSVTSQGAAALNPSFNPINLTVQATNSGGNGTGTATVTVQSGAVPVVTPETFGLVIPTTGNSLIGFPIPATNSPTGWSITAGNSSGFYAINNAGQLSIASSYTSGIQPGSYPLTVVASNASGNSIGATVTVIANVYVDGFAGASLGTIPQAALFTAYGANRPPWKVAGVDYPVGQASGITVIGTTAVNPTQTQITNSGAATGVTIAGSTVTLSGPNPSLGSATVGFTFAVGTVINVLTSATGTATIRNVVVTGNASGNAGIQINMGNGAAANLTILNSEVNGQKVSNSATTGNDSAIYYGGNGTTTIKYCYFHGLSCDVIQIQSGTNQSYDIRWNLAWGFGYSPAQVGGVGHPDFLQLLSGALLSGVAAFNAIVQPVDGTAGQGGDNEVFANIADGTGVLNNTIHANNSVMSLGTSGQTSSLLYGSFVETTSARINKHQVVFNYFDPSGSGFAAWYGQNNANWQNVTTGTLGVYLGNRLLTTGALSNPTTIGYVPAGSTTGATGAPTTTDVAVASGSPVTASPATGTLITNQSCTFTVTATRALTIQGSPQLNLSNGSRATYSAGSGTSSIQFVYTVGASDTNATNLAITGTTIPAGSLIIDLFGNTADMTGANVTFSGLNVSTTSTAPVITNSGTIFTIIQPLSVGQTAATMTANGSPTSWAITAATSAGGISDWTITTVSGNGVIKVANASLPTGSFTITVTASNANGPSNPGQAIVNIQPASSFADGTSAASVGGVTPFPTIFSGYSVRPSWNVPGVDYAVGVNSAALPLKNPTTAALPANCSYASATRRVTVASGSNGVTLDGWDFSVGSGVVLFCAGANNLTVRNCKFAYTTTPSGNIMPIDTLGGSAPQNLIVEYCEIDGTNIATTNNNTGLISTPQQAAGSITVRYCYLHDASEDFMSLGGSTITIKFNVMARSGFQGHPDYMQTPPSTTVHPTLILTNNLCYQPTSNPGQGFMWADVAYAGTTNSMDHNTMIAPPSGGGMNAWIGLQTAAQAGTTNAVDHNYVDGRGNSSGFSYNGTSGGLITAPAGWTFTNNINLATGGNMNNGDPNK